MIEPATLPSDHLPAGWRIASLGSCLVEPPRYGIGAPAMQYDEELPTYIRITDITEDGRYSTENRASVVYPSHGEHYLKPGDIVLARTGASVGKSYLYDERDGRLVFAGFLIRVRPDPRVLLPEFAATFITTTAYWNWVAQNSARSGQPGINAAEYGRMPILLPPIGEQGRIVDLLRDADAHVRTLDGALRKYRNLRTGAVQALVGGRSRLRGFDGEWRRCVVGDVLTVRHGRSQRAVEEDSGCFPILATSGEIGRSSVSLHDGPSVLIGRKGTIDRPQYIDGPFWSIDTLFYTEISDGADPKFVYYLFSTIDWQAHNESSGRPSLNARTIENIPVRVPEYEEQRAIASVLDDFDSEVVALEAAGNKARLLKQGLVQEVLAGRTLVR